MKKRKGFTLVELIAVIALLAVVILIAGISVVKIKERVNKGQRDNLRTTIKIAAREYHEETGIDKIPVQVLLQSGKIPADEIAKADIDSPKISKGEPIIYDPIDNKIINCEYVDFSESDTGKWVEDDGCTPEILAYHAVVINYLYADQNKVELKSGTFDEATQDKWFALANGETFTLSSALNNVDDTMHIEYLWTTPSAPDVIKTEKEIQVDLGTNNLTDIDYNLSVRLDNNAVSSNFHIKLDGTYPVVENVYVTDADAWKSEKYIHASLSDTGSRLNGYAIVELPEGKTIDNVSCKTASYITSGIQNEENFELNYKVPANKDYVLCVKDNSGNIFKYGEKINVHMLDPKEPVITVKVVDPTTYKISNTAYITIEPRALDNANISGFAKLDGEQVKYVWSEKVISACPSNSGILNLTYDSAKGEYVGQVDIVGKTGPGKIYVCPNGEIKDNAGNVVSNSPASSDMYLDSTKPSGSISITSTKTYNVLSAKYTISNLKDQTNGSGLDKICINATESTDKCDWKSASDGTTSYTFKGTDGSGESYTLYLHVRDKAGNIYTKSADYTLYKYCSKTTSETSCGSCSASCGGGTKKCTVYSYDYYVSSLSCGTDTVRKSCNTRSCPASDPSDYPSSSGGGSSSSGSTCGALCKMQKNSAEWNALEADSKAHPENAEANEAKQKALHEENMSLKDDVSQCKSNCSFDEHSGTYSKPDGTRLY